MSQAESRIAGQDLDKWSSIVLTAVAVTLALSLWFAGSAVLPQLTREWRLSQGVQSWMTMAVQLGFVVGALLSSLLNLADRTRTNRLFAISALGAALSTSIMTMVTAPLAAVACRLLTGFFLAGVYPPGMKLMATWTRRDRGLGIGILVGALTLGSALPHLLTALPLGGEISGMPPWRTVLWATSGLAALAAAIAALLLREGPDATQTVPFDWRFVNRALSHRPTRLANFGYLGHMWELYAMWAWVPILLLASYARADLDLRSARLAGFASIAVGALGCVVAGYLADRHGRTLIAMWSLVVSGTCAILVGALFEHPIMLTWICLVWGATVVADSAQFSAAVTELTDERYIGTSLTMQTCLGFLLTMISLRLIPALLELVGWEWVFMSLVPGPLFGLWSLGLLRRSPAARRMASGRR